MKRSFSNIIRKPLTKVWKKASDANNYDDDDESSNINCLIKIEQKKFSYIEVILDEGEDGENYCYDYNTISSLFDDNKDVINSDNNNEDEFFHYYPNEIIDDYERYEEDDENDDNDIFHYNDDDDD